MEIGLSLWFDSNAEEAADFYLSVFKNSKLIRKTYYTKQGYEYHGRPEGSVMTVELEINGKHITALNGGPVFKFNEAVSLVIYCENQEEVDYYWEALTKGGDKEAQQCGWLKDRFGVSWQVVPKQFLEIINGTDKMLAERALEIMFTMKKLDINQIMEKLKRIN